MPARVDLDPGANRTPVRARSDTLHHQPVVPVPALVAQQGGPGIQVVHDDVDVAVVVQITERASASVIFSHDSRSRLRGNVFEAALAQIAIENAALFVGDMQLAARQLSVDMAIGDENVLPAVVVEIKKADAETEIFAVDTQTGRQAGILKRAVTIIAVQGRDLIGKICADDIEPAVAIVVADPHSHAAQGNSVFVKGASGRYRNLAEGAVTIVVIKQAWRGIARDIDIGPSIVVKVRG